MGSQGSEMQGNILVVTLEIRASVQTWSSHVLEAEQFLQRKRPENPLSVDAFLEGRELSKHTVC